MGEADKIEAVAQAIYEATDPLSGDPISVLIHVSDHLFWDGAEGDDDLARQLEAVKIICRAAAKAAIGAIESLENESGT